MYLRFPTCSAKLMPTRHIYWVFKYRNITHTNFTLQNKIKLGKNNSALHTAQRAIMIDL